MEEKVHSLDGDTDLFEIVASVLQGNTWAPYLFIIGQDYVLRMSTDLMKENGFTLKKARTKWNPTQTIANIDNAVDIALLANIPTQAKSLLHSLEQAAGGSMSMQKKWNTCVLIKRRHLHTKWWLTEVGR